VAAWLQSIAIAILFLITGITYWQTTVHGAVYWDSDFRWLSALACIGIPYGALMLAASWQLSQLRRYTISVLVGVLAYCAPLGLVWLIAFPIAIWAHVILWRQEVKDAFELDLRERIRAASGARPESARGVATRSRSKLQGVLIVVILLLAIVFLCQANLLQMLSRGCLGIGPILGSGTPNFKRRRSKVWFAKHALIRRRLKFGVPDPG
jgi:hypothetical protein